MAQATKDERVEALNLAINQIEKQFGKGSIMKLGEDFKVDIPVIRSGALPLDIAMGVGGFPRGRIVEIFGPESSGKTTLALHAIAEAQRQGGTAAFIDAEHALDPTYAKKLGIDLDNLLVSQPDTGEQALEICELLVRSNVVDLIVIDSVAALVPRVEIEGQMGDSHMGVHARLMSQALRKLTAIINRSKTCVIFINQIRMKIGVVYGNPETTTGGTALKFYSSMRLEVRRVTSIKQGEDVTGNKIRVKVVKNKMAPPFKTVEMDIIFGEGISRESSLIDMGVDLKLAEKAGSWFSYKNQRIGQGKENARLFLKENPRLANELENEILKVGLGQGNSESQTNKPSVKAERKEKA